MNTHTPHQLALNAHEMLEEACRRFQMMPIVYRCGCRTGRDSTRLDHCPLHAAAPALLAALEAMAEAFGDTLDMLPYQGRAVTQASSAIRQAKGESNVDRRESHVQGAKS